MDTPFLTIANAHTEDCGRPPIVTNCVGGKLDGSKYIGYFQNRFGEQWVFVYDFKLKVGELRGGDIGWESVVEVKDGRADIVLGKAETAWLETCWKAATGVG